MIVISAEGFLGKEKIYNMAKWQFVFNYDKYKYEKFKKIIINTIFDGDTPISI